jgi:hypothetical protein
MRWATRVEQGSGTQSFKEAFANGNQEKSSQEKEEKVSRIAEPSLREIFQGKIVMTGCSLRTPFLLLPIYCRGFIGVQRHQRLQDPWAVQPFRLPVAHLVRKGLCLLPIRASDPRHFVSSAHGMGPTFTI